MYNGSYNNRQTPTYINEVYTIPKAIGLYNKFTFQVSIQSKYIVSIGQSYNISRTIQNVAGLTSYRNFTNITNLGVTVNLPKGLGVSSTFDYTKNSNLAKPMPLWNAFATYRALKSETIELKFSAMDMLRKFQNISNSSDMYGTSTRISNGLQQYFLFTISYFPRKFGKTEIKRQVVEQVW